ncbi:MAG TPA: EAL domain-containing protein [Beijerinckiaceae bacterium]|nr:EAL domain-containing protein [Beijerinckiaceae bacterium]
MFIGASQVGAATGEETVFFSRRLETRSGDFIGMVSVGVRPEFFLRLYDGISAVPGAFVRLTRPDGTILVSYPDHLQRKKLSDGSQWYAVMKNGGGHFRTGGRELDVRLVAARRVDRYPIVVNVGVQEQSVLELWRSRAMVIGAAALMAALAVTALICVLFVLYRRAVDAQARVGEQSQQLSNANLRFDSVLSNMKQGVAMFDDKNRIVLHNRRYAEMYRLYSEEIPPGTPLASIINLRIARGIYDRAGPERYRIHHMSHLGQGALSHQSALEHLEDGRYVLVSHQPMEGGGWVTTHEDVTESQQAAARIAHMARHDALTGLANRVLFLERVEEAARADGACFAILLIDLDEFKAVNDTFGHPVGDALLAAVSARLCAATGPHDVVARLGGDEFAILRRLPEPDSGLSSALATRLLNDVRERYHIEGRVVKIGLSIGIAVAPAASSEPNAIMRQADLALYRAKAEGRNCARLFEPAMAEEIQSRRELAVDLDAALVKGELEVHYQPIIDTVSGDTIAMEALARWRHPLRGKIAPSIFIPLAEEADLIDRLGAFVLEAACRDAMAWPSSVKVSVNVSATQVTRSGLVGAVNRALIGSGLPATRLQIEITESVLLGDDDHNLGVLRELRDAGIMIVLDDFGTGFSSLGYLNRFPLDKIKIDRSFIDQLGTDAGSAAIVAAVTSIAAAFQAVTTAEGVETEEQYRFLRATAVAELQGYLFGAPRPANDWIFDGLRAAARVEKSLGAAAA